VKLPRLLALGASTKKPPPLHVTIPSVASVNVPGSTFTT
jgi:hypothetical protein